MNKNKYTNFGKISEYKTAVTKQIRYDMITIYEKTGVFVHILSGGKE